ncbi:hypothetical protein FB107DRAFT_280250 [Schizophyllum commune]
MPTRHPPSASSSPCLSPPPARPPSLRRAIPPSSHVIPPPALPTRRARRPTACSAPAIPPALKRVPTLLSPRCRTSSAVPRAARSPGSKARLSAYAENARGRLGIALARWPSGHASGANAEDARRSSGSALEQKLARVGLLLVVRSRSRRLGACRSGPARAVPPLARRRVTLRRCPRALAHRRHALAHAGCTSLRQDSTRGGDLRATCPRRAQPRAHSQRERSLQPGDQALPISCALKATAGERASLAVAAAALSWLPWQHASGDERSQCSAW